MASATATQAPPGHNGERSGSNASPAAINERQVARWISEGFAAILPQIMNPITARLDQMEDSIQYLGRAGQFGAARQQVPQQYGTAQQVLGALQGIRLATVSSTIPVPKFNQKKTTSTDFLKDVERYYRAQQYHPNDYLFLVKNVLPSDAKEWWEHVRQRINSWEEFKEEFQQKYDGPDNIMERMRILQTRLQRLHEPTETFIYEMIKMSRVVYPHESLEFAVERTRNALYPQIRLALGAQRIGTPEELVKTCIVVHRCLEAQARVSKETIRLPPLSKIDGDKSTDGHKFKKSKEKHKEKSKDKNEENQGESSSRGSGSLQFTNSQRRGSRPYDSSRQFRGRGSFPSRGNPYRGNEKREDPAKDQSQKSNSQSGNPSSSAGQDKKNLANVQCIKCKGFGHLSKQCPNKRGVALIAGDNEWETEYEADYDESQMDEYVNDEYSNQDLNSEERKH